jgi:Rrf2 family protein
VITNRVEYLILTLVDLAVREGDEYVTSREVADRQGIPPKYMPQIVSILTRKGWVDSMRGPRGGIRLAVNPEDLTVQDVIDATDDRLLVKQCLDSDSECPRKESCPLRGIWLKAQQQVTSVMQGTTLSDLISSRSLLGKQNRHPEAGDLPQVLQEHDAQTHPHVD